MHTIFRRKRNIIFNIVLWFLYYIILIFIFSKGKTPETIDYIYALGFLGIIAIPIVLSTYVLVPKLLQRGKYVLFSMAILGICILFWQIYIRYFDRLLDAIFPEYYFISYQTELQAMTKFTLFLVVSVLLRIFESWLYYNAAQNRFLQLENQRIQLQLSHLRSQINPHFLFNSLNVIYSLAIEKKEETQDAIVQLSDVLRYIIYDANTDKITLKDEIKLLKNYIAFQKFRTHGLESITFDIDIEDDTFEIYPMLLLPLVENAFKHGVKTNDTPLGIDISLVQKGDTCSFYIKNPMRVELQDKVKNYSGVGLENVKNNLEIVYPNQHEIQIEKESNTFAVFIKIIHKKIER